MDFRVFARRDISDDELLLRPCTGGWRDHFPDSGVILASAVLRVRERHQITVVFTFVPQLLHVLSSNEPIRMKTGNRSYTSSRFQAVAIHPVPWPFLRVFICQTGRVGRVRTCPFTVRKVA